MAVIADVPFLKEKRAERKYENEFKKIQESVTEKKSDVNGLVKKNKDCIGYVEIPGTTISYPVITVQVKMIDLLCYTYLTFMKIMVK